MKKIRSISLSNKIDELLEEDSKERGLTVSANLSRILYDYFENETKKTINKPKLKVN